VESKDHGRARICVDLSPKALECLAWLFVELIGSDDINLHLVGSEVPQAGWVESEIASGDFLFYEEPDGSLSERGDYVIASLTSEGEGELHVAVAQLVQDTLESVQKLYKTWNKAQPERRGPIQAERKSFLGSLRTTITVDLSQETQQWLAWLFLNHVDETGLNLEIFSEGDGGEQVVITVGDEDSRAQLEALGFDPSDDLIATIMGEADVALGFIAYDTLVSVQELFKEWAEKAPAENLTEEGFIEALGRHNS
jgi:hypothetical protein